MEQVQLRQRAITCLQRARSDLEQSRPRTSMHGVAAGKQPRFEIAGDEEAQRALRFATYHLITATNPVDEHVSIGARGMTGEAYRGHVFWDTEIYMLPFYVLTDPPAARALLMYRYHTLEIGPAKSQSARLCRCPLCVGAGRHRR